MSTNRDLPKTGLALAVLTLLNERPMHPYEMKVLMEERGHEEVIKLKGGSLYDTVDRLEKLGFIKSREPSREGRRPERTVYALTDTGRDEVQAWMRELISVPVNEFPRFTAALAFLLNLRNKDEVVQLLQRRVTFLEAEIARAERMLESARAQQHILPIFLIEGEYAQAMRRAEVVWVNGLIHDIRDGDMWPPHEALLAIERELQKAREVS
jgi:DNA-binding PadR family transcriptional regulator